MAVTDRQRRLHDRFPGDAVADRWRACFPAWAGCWSACQAGRADGGIIAGIGDALKGHVAQSLDSPFVVMLEQEGADAGYLGFPEPETTPPPIVTPRATAHPEFVGLTATLKINYRLN